MMTTSRQGSSSHSTLHIRSAPLSRAQRDALATRGVELEHLTPREINDAIADGRNEGGAERRDEILRRLERAPVCILDEGTGIELGTLILTIRQDQQHRTLTTIEPLRQVAAGMAVRQETLGLPKLRCELLRKSELFEALCALGIPTTLPAVARANKQPAIRPPRPLPYGGNPEAYVFLECRQSRHAQWKYHGMRAGRLEPRALLAEGPEADQNGDAVGALTFFIRHLASSELELLGSQGARAWWHRLRFEELDNPDGHHAAGVESVIWEALARDGGQATLAALPDRFLPMRDAASAAWQDAIVAIERGLPMELTSAAACARPTSLGAKILKSWDIIPCDDPLAPDADPNLFRPTLTTLRVARRYRSAPEVLLEAYRRWGGRPYLEDATADQLKRFVQESSPTSARDVDEWVRLLTTLPENRLRRFVSEAIATRWYRIEIPLVNTLPNMTTSSIGSPTEQSIAERTPCFTEYGELHNDWVNEIASSSRRRDIRDLQARLAPVRTARRTDPNNLLRWTTPMGHGGA